ncbi:hypothetical protein [Paenibacillus cremeus]|uniref:hypothetical protein n=1 Tax=Paenibacillus cremeus TaxID=2163881 RepID=UPI001645B517|nr:hypothetical protein [Paenibacillus cremeus]
MQAYEEKQIGTDTILEDYEEYLDDDDDRWRPPGTPDVRRKKTTFGQPKPFGVRKR